MKPRCRWTSSMSRSTRWAGPSSGLTLGCARCHDHKFDPIDTADYYGLAGIFKSSRAMEHYKKVARWYENVLPIAGDRRDQGRSTTLRLRRRRSAIDDFIAEADEKVRASLAARRHDSRQAGNALSSRDEGRNEEAARRADAVDRRTRPTCPRRWALTEDQVADEAIHIRGNPTQAGRRSLPGTCRRPFADRQRRSSPLRKAAGGSWPNGSSIRGIRSPVACS